MDWFVINTKHHHEGIAEQSLKRLGLETFCPPIRQTKVIRRRKQTVVRPLFPGYLFARFDLSTYYRAVSYAQGVRKLVSFGPMPEAVDEGIIQSIKSRMHEGYIQIPSTRFVPGQTVRIQEGPFHGLEALFEESLNDCQRVVLLLRTISFQARVVVGLDQVVGY